jgi:SNF2 family DNA or RNA helicase
MLARNLRLRPLRQHQKDATSKFATAMSAFFALDMRLGKTITSIRWIKRRINGRKISVIVAPKTTLLSWEEELQKEYIVPVLLEGSSIQKAHTYLSQESRSWMLVNYEAFLSKEFLRAFDKHPPDALLLDESTRIKNHKSKTTQALMQICDIVPLKICLSGLPTPQSLEDIWSQMAFLNNGRWMGCSNFYRWRKRHTEIDPTSFGEHGRIFPPAQERLIIAKYQSEAFCLTRKQAEKQYGLAMPDKVFEKYHGEMSKEEKFAYKYVVKNMELPEGPFSNISKRVRETDPDFEDILGMSHEADHAIVQLSWLRRIPTFLPTSWKYTELVDLLRTLGADKGKEKVVVWFAFSAEIQNAKERLIKEGIACRSMQGTTPTHERRAMIKEFNTSPSMNVILIQKKLGQFGLNLSVSSTAIYFSNSYSLEQRAQSEDRIFLPGKKNLLIIDLITKGTTDEEVRSILSSKRTVSARTLARKALDQC